VATPDGLASEATLHGWRRLTAICLSGSLVPPGISLAQFPETLNILDVYIFRERDRAHVVALGFD
jgi:hypothetical protein